MSNLGKDAAGRFKPSWDYSLDIVNTKSQEHLPKKKQHLYVQVSELRSQIVTLFSFFFLKLMSRVGSKHRKFEIIGICHCSGRYPHKSSNKTEKQPSGSRDLLRKIQ